MPPSRRPRSPQPQTQRCRFADAAGQCRAIATVGEFCGTHAGVIEQAVRPARPLGGLVDGLVDGLFGVRRYSRQEWARLGADAAREVIGQRFPGMGRPPGVPQSQPAPPPPPRQIPPEAIERRKRILAARGVMGFEPDQVLTVDQIRRKHRQLVPLFHDDVHATADARAARKEMLVKLNLAAELLVDAARAQPPRRPPT